MGAADVDLVEMADATITSGDGDIFELYVHVVFGFEELTAVDLTGCDFKCYYVALEKIKLARCM